MRRPGMYICPPVRETPRRALAAFRSASNWSRDRYQKSRCQFGSTLLPGCWRPWLPISLSGWQIPLEVHPIQAAGLNRQIRTPRATRLQTARIEPSTSPTFAVRSFLESFGNVARNAGKNHDPKYPTQSPHGAPPGRLPGLIPPVHLPCLGLRSTRGIIKRQGAPVGCWHKMSYLSEGPRRSRLLSGVYLGPSSGRPWIERGRVTLNYEVRMRAKSVIRGPNHHPPFPRPMTGENG